MSFIVLKKYHPIRLCIVGLVCTCMSDERSASLSPFSQCWIVHTEHAAPEKKVVYTLYIGGRDASHSQSPRHSPVAKQQWT